MSRVFTVDDIQEITKVAKMMGVEAVWCTILFKGCENPVEFYCSPNEEDPFQREMYERLMSEQYGPLKDEGVGLWYHSIPPNQKELEEAALEKRTKLLVESDYIDLPTTRERLSAEKIAEWETYRQALRDMTNQQGWPWDPKWPVKP